MTDKKDNSKLGEVERSFEPGRENGYQTDNVSRNDLAGVPADELCAADEKKKGTASVEAKPDADPAKAGDDADSRDATPMTPREGGVR
jgi:hypothetical protein